LFFGNGVTGGGPFGGWAPHTPDFFCPFVGGGGREATRAGGLGAGATHKRAIGGGAPPPQNRGDLFCLCGCSGEKRGAQRTSRGGMALAGPRFFGPGKKNKLFRAGGVGGGGGGDPGGGDPPPTPPPGHPPGDFSSGSIRFSKRGGGPGTRGGGQIPPLFAPPTPTNILFVWTTQHLGGFGVVFCQGVWGGPQKVIGGGGGTPATGLFQKVRLDSRAPPKERGGPFFPNPHKRAWGGGFCRGLRTKKKKPRPPPPPPPHFPALGGRFISTTQKGGWGGRIGKWGATFFPGFGFP